MTELSREQVRGIVFDLDDTLIHSTIDFGQMRRMTFTLFGLLGVPDYCLDHTKTITYNLNASFRFLSETGRESDATMLRIEAGKIMSEIEMLRVAGTSTIPGSERAIESLLENGYSVSILTRGSRRYTDAALTAAGLARFFPNRVCRDDYPEEEAKPNPLSMSRAAGMMGLTKRQCLLVGDHVVDLECARSAGSRFVGLDLGVDQLN